MKLDLDQQKVVAHKEGHALVLAGAGSGKTACVTNRAAFRIFGGLDPSRILLLTFTNKACREMKERLAALIEPYGADLPLVSTFHAFGHRLVRKYPHAHCRRPGASMIDPDDMENLLKKIFMDVGIPKEAYKKALETFSMVRNDGLNAMLPSEKDAIMRVFEDTGAFSYEECDRMVDVGRRYEEKKREMNLLDFDDLINLPIHALQSDPDLRSKLNKHLQDITVDESQDNNKAQYKLLRLLAGKTVVMVGDDDQSIHRWRGAHPEGLEQFKKEFGPTVFRLERNYRSLPVIVNSATRLIRHNEDRLEKNPYPTRQDDQRKIPCHIHQDSHLMAERIALDLKTRIQAGLNPSRAAILYRTNAMARVLEPSLLRHGIPYRIKRGMDLMSYSEVKMLMAGARLAVNPCDGQAFARISGLISGLGAKTVEKLTSQTAEQGILSNLDLAPPKHRETLAALKKSLESLYTQGPRKLLPWAIGPAGFKVWLQSEAEKAAKAKGLSGKAHADEVQEGLMRRIERLKLIQETVIARLEALPEDTPTEDLWAEAMDMLIQPPDEDPESGAVILSTVHGSKGLQWETVHIAGFSETLMPFERDGAVQNMTEERCLAYVGMTRAENNLFLHHPRRLDMRMGGEVKNVKLSRFINESLDSQDPAIELQHIDPPKKQNTMAGFLNQHRRM